MLFGAVMHHRLRPVEHRFTHPVCFLRVPVDRLEQCAHAVFGVNRWNLFSLHYRDYGPGDGTPPAIWIRRLLADAGLGAIDGPIELQTFPRVLGYAFNPVSFWFCHDRSGCLRAVLCEVNNTFGERHSYLLEVGGDGAPIRTRKIFHVSPFCPVAGQYRFAFPAGRSLVRIDYADSAGDLLYTSIFGTAVGWGPRIFLVALARYGWMSAMVIGRIHYQALRLWLKGARFHPKPVPPAVGLSRGDAQSTAQGRSNP